jgi:hypothetical protein
MRSITRNLIICTPSECVILVMISRRIGGARPVTHVRERKCVNCFLVNPERKRPLGKPRSRQGIRLKYTLKKEDGRTWIAFIWLRTVASCMIFWTIY